jgi:MFS family permease
VRRPHSTPLNALERRAVASLGGIFVLRLLGLFLILPVFALYADQLERHTPFLVGLALGAYGLTQGVLQIPFGMASDRLGRKPVIAAGLLIFAFGSVVAALATTIEGVIVGRALQGAGAVSAAVVAMIADLTREQTRTKAMAIIGISVGGSFILSLMLGPVFNAAIGVPGIFWMTAALALLGIAVLFLFAPTPTRTETHAEVEAVPRQFWRVLRDGRLLRLDLGIFFLHCALTAVFVAVPLVLVRHAGLPASEHWKVYLPVMLTSVVFMFPLIALAEKRARTRAVFAGAVVVLAASQTVLYETHTTLTGIVVGLFLYFVAFNVLEAMLPSLISKTAPPAARGTAIGVFSTFEFLGAFAGGALGGFVHGRFGLAVVFQVTAALLALWFVIAVTAPLTVQLRTRMLRVGHQRPEQARELARKLAAVRGVVEATVVGPEGIAYLRVDSRQLDTQALRRFQPRA